MHTPQNDEARTTALVIITAFVHEGPSETFSSPTVVVKVRLDPSACSLSVSVSSITPKVQSAVLPLTLVPRVTVSGLCTPKLSRSRGKYRPRRQRSRTNCSCLAVRDTPFLAMDSVTASSKLILQKSIARSDSCWPVISLSSCRCIRPRSMAMKVRNDMPRSFPDSAGISAGAEQPPVASISSINSLHLSTSPLPVHLTTPPGSPSEATSPSKPLLKQG
mmetsp:Transcript_46908/g.101920  ORF Transcript_46908/g.101920 Transcript_46908/m.101920 type:complete len:219 (-) Transcript_46908:863-1519(-)